MSNGDRGNGWWEVSRVQRYGILRGVSSEVWLGLQLGFGETLVDRRSSKRSSQHSKECSRRCPGMQGSLPLQVAPSQLNTAPKILTNSHIRGTHHPRRPLFSSTTVLQVSVFQPPPPPPSFVDVKSFSAILFCAKHCQFAHLLIHFTPHILLHLPRVQRRKKVQVWTGLPTSFPLM